MKCADVCLHCCFDDWTPASASDLYQNGKLIKIVLCLLSSAWKNAECQSRLFQRVIHQARCFTRAAVITGCWAPQRVTQSHWSQLWFKIRPMKSRIKDWYLNWGPTSPGIGVSSRWPWIPKAKQGYSINMGLFWLKSVREVKEMHKNKRSRGREALL